MHLFYWRNYNFIVLTFKKSAKYMLVTWVEFWVARCLSQMSDFFFFFFYSHTRIWRFFSCIFSVSWDRFRRWQHPSKKTGFRWLSVWRGFDQWLSDKELTACFPWKYKTLLTMHVILFHEICFTQRYSSIPLLHPAPFSVS